MGVRPPPDPLAPAGGEQLLGLLAGIASGRPDDLAALYDATHTRVFTLARRIVGDDHLAEEVTHDVFLQVWQQADRYDAARGRPLAWLLMMTRSRALDRRRAGHRQPTGGAVDAAEAAPLEDPGHGPADRAEGSERSVRLRGALAVLPEVQRGAIELAFFEGLTHHEIASRLEQPLGTVKTWIRRGLLRLRDVLAVEETT